MKDYHCNNPKHDPPRHHPLECVTVCIGYADFLAVSMPLNLPQLDRWIVVTEPGDNATRRLCKEYGVQCIISQDAFRHDSPFNKGRLIERGLQHTSEDGWRLHLDADVVLPSQTRHYLKAAELDTTCIYGADRMMVKSYAVWQKVSSYLHQHRYTSGMYVPGLQLGTRWTSTATGYVPIGFFHLWHSSQDQYEGIRSRPYPDRHNDACRSDIQFALLWDRPHRQLLPEFVVFHLESEPAKLGANWLGRVTKRFGK